MFHQILSQFGLDASRYRATPFGSGLINQTWKMEGPAGSFILQRVNTAIFKQPEHIADNIRLVKNFISKSDAGYLLPAPVAAPSGHTVVYDESGACYRLIPFVEGSLSLEVATSPQQAYEAARQFGGFTRRLQGFDTSDLQLTLPDFHNLTLRFDQFEAALQTGNKARLSETSGLIEAAMANRHLVDTYAAIKANPDFRLRVTHHDTKISNVLFNSKNEGLCVIDLDTVMPGYFISDVGDMMRTYLSALSEESDDYAAIEVRDDFYRAIVSGYCSEMKAHLTPAEQGAFFYAGQFMIYMQGIRFLTDYLLNDRYYGARYPTHNLVRATNQFTLLGRLNEKAPLLAAFI